MNRIYLLVLLLGAASLASAQTVVPPYNPDANGDSAIGAPDLLGLLPLVWHLLYAGGGHGRWPNAHRIHRRPRGSGR